MNPYEKLKVRDDWFEQILHLSYQEKFSRMQAEQHLTFFKPVHKAAMEEYLEVTCKRAKPSDGSWKKVAQSITGCCFSL